MTYVEYNPETGEVFSIGLTEPEESSYFVTSETLTGDESDYIVQNGILYRKDHGSEFGYLENSALYYMIYDFSGAITSVSATKPSNSENYIPVLNDPGNNVIGKIVSNLTEFSVEVNGKGYLNSDSQLPLSGNTAGDFYNIRNTSVRYIWDGDDWVSWNTASVWWRSGEYGDVWIESEDDLPESGMVVNERYCINLGNGRMRVYTYTSNGWSTSEAVITKAIVSGNSYDLLTEIDATLVEESLPSGTSETESSIENKEVNNGRDTIVSMTLIAGNWAVRDVTEVDEGEEIDEETSVDVGNRTMVYVVASDYVRHNTVLQITGVNVGALRGDIRWYCEDGYITFETDYGFEPYEDVEINGVFHTTTDSWNAMGLINAWPQGEWRKVQYQQSANVPNWSIDIRAGESVLIETPLNMTFAQLLYISPEWCGNTHAFLTQYYVGSGNNKLYLRITNLATQPIRINDILLSIIYSGNIVNFIAPNGLAEEDSTSTVSSEGATDTYITDEDIDEVT